MLLIGSIGTSFHFGGRFSTDTMILSIGTNTKRLSINNYNALKISVACLFRESKVARASRLRSASQRHALPYFSWSPERPTRFRSGVLPIFDDLHTVHEHMFHTGGILVRLFKGGVIGDSRRIEHHHVGEHSFL